MKIFYDGKIYDFQPQGGISRYFKNLIQHLPPSITPVITTCRTTLNGQAIEYPAHPNLKLHQYQRFGFRPGRVSYYLEPYYFKLQEILEQPSVAHPTYYNLLTRQPVVQYKCPWVLTVHDMIHELFPHLFKSSKSFLEEKRRAILAADAIICVSHNTRKDLLEKYPTVESKAIVIPLATELNPNKIDHSLNIPSRPYFLYVGLRGYYKNFKLLLTAFAKATECNSDVMLCVVGPPWEATEQQDIIHLGLAERIEQYSFIDDRLLATLYHHSLAFIYPSLYEGFGIPLLEAMSCGTVVIASNTASIPEVVGDAGILFDPYSPNELADILLHLLNQPLERQYFIAKGQQQIQQFSWLQTAQQTLSVYQSIA